MKVDTEQRGVLRAGGWDNGFFGANHVALHDGSVGAQFLARSISRATTRI